MNNGTVTTPWGIAEIKERTSDGGLLVCLPKEKMTTPHPNYHGGPCVFFIHYENQADNPPKDVSRFAKILQGLK